MIRLGHNAVPATAEKELLKVFRSGQYSPGLKVREFENRWAELHKAKHAIFVNSGTDALRLGLLAMKEAYGWNHGSGVLVPATTFVASVNAIIQAGLTPVLVDVNESTYTMDIHALEKGIYSRSNLVAVMPVHLFGQSCHRQIHALAKKLRLRVIEDSCETVTNPLKGDVSCHSTYMAHHVTTGVGGFAVTNSARLNLLIRSYANHGRNEKYLPGYRSLGMGKDLLKKRFRFERMGYSCRGTEFEAVLGLSQLKDIAGQLEKRRRIAESLCMALQFTDDFILPSKPRRDMNTWMMFPILIKKESRIDKYDFCLHLEKHGIETRDMMPITNQPCYPGLIAPNYPVSDWLNKKGFYIPCHAGMTQKEVDYIDGAFLSYLQK